MALSLAELLGEHWEDYARAHRQQLCAAHYRAARSVLACRTPAMGGRLYRCSGCAKNHYAYHSCNHRSCPQCGARDQQVWTAKQEARLLPVPYFMVTFTIPEELRRLCHAHPKILYDLILRESAGALRDLIATKYQGARCGFTSVLHTWGRQVQHHPHLHLIVPAVAYQSATGQLIHPKKDKFLVHFRPLAQRFRSRIFSALKNDHPEIYEALTPVQRQVLSPAKTWNVQLQPVGRGKTALRYLARYVQRSAFGAKRLLGYDPHGKVRLQWTCSTTKRTSVMTLHPHEFIRRWLLHVLPKGFTRVRHYGFLSSAARKTRLLIRAKLGEFGESPRRLVGGLDEAKRSPKGEGPGGGTESTRSRTPRGRTLHLRLLRRRAHLPPGDRPDPPPARPTTQTPRQNMIPHHRQLRSAPPAAVSRERAPTNELISRHWHQSQPAITRSPHRASSTALGAGRIPERFASRPPQSNAPGHPARLSARKPLTLRPKSKTQER